MSVSLAKGDKVKVAFEGTVDVSSSASNDWAAVLSPKGTYMYLEKSVMTRVLPPEPPSGSLVGNAGGKYIRVGTGSRSWFFLDECCSRLSDYGKPWADIESDVKVLYQA